MDKNELLITLLKLPKIGKITAKKIFNEIYHSECNLNDLFEYLQNINRKEISLLEIFRAKEYADKIISECEELSINIVNFTEEHFPIKLLELKNPPVLLYYKGDIHRLNQNPSIAIIGTREPSKYGVEIAKKYTEFFVNKGFNIVSGLAKGIDGISHEMTVNSCGHAVAYLAQGLNTPIYPKENRELSERILSNAGVLISEYAPDVKPSRNYFVERDRLQSGSSDAVLVIETGLSGGSLHAANSAVELDRYLSVLNHPEKYKIGNEKSQGNEMLIKEKGAIPLFSKESLEELSDKIAIKHERFIKIFSQKLTELNNKNSSNENKPEQILFDI